MAAYRLNDINEYSKRIQFNNSFEYSGNTTNNIQYTHYQFHVHNFYAHFCILKRIPNTV